MRGKKTGEVNEQPNTGSTEPAAAPTSTTSDIVVGTQPSRYAKQRKFGLIGLAVLVVAGSLAFFFWPKPIAAPTKVDLQGLVDYSDMNRDQADYYLYTKTGLTFEYLNKKGISSSTVKTYDAAVQVAQAYASILEKHKALEAYAVAQDKKPDDGTYQFYLDYAHYALSAGDKTTWKEEMLLARDIAAKQKKSTYEDKYSISPVDKINGEIVVVEGSSDATN